MPRATEIYLSLYGCYRLARRDIGGLAFFNMSLPGFWSSFWAIPLALTVMAIQNLLEYRQDFADMDLSQTLLSLTITTLVSWLIYLAAIGFATKFLNVSANLLGFVIVYNWAQLALMCIWLPISVLTLGFFGPEATNMVALFYIGFSYFFLWYILTVTLNVTGSSAIALAFMEFFIVLIVHNLTLNALHGMFGSVQ